MCTTNEKSCSLTNSCSTIADYNGRMVFPTRIQIFYRENLTRDNDQIISNEAQLDKYDEQEDSHMNTLKSNMNIQILFDGSLQRVVSRIDGDILILMITCCLCHTCIKKYLPQEFVARRNF